MRDLCCVAPLREPGKLRFQEHETGAVLQRLCLRVPSEAALLHQRGHAVDHRAARTERFEQFANGLRLPLRRIAAPSQITLAARRKVRPRVSPPLKMLRADGDLEIFGGGLREQS